MPGGTKQVKFTRTTHTDASATFENPEHDAPKAIRYERKGTGLVAQLSGGFDMTYPFASTRYVPAPELEQADLAFAAAVKAGGVAAWVDAFAPDGWQWSKGGVVPRDKVGELMAPILTSGLLAWAPIASGKHGTLGYTVDREIPKHQRAITAAGLAFRSMLVHPAIVDLTWSLTPETRDPGGVSRGLMRDVITRSVPEAIFDKPKAGFDVPFDRWFRGPLRPMIEELLAPKRLEAQGIFNSAPIKREWTQHISGKYDRRYILFDLLMFQLWLESLRQVPGYLNSQEIAPLM